MGIPVGKEVETRFLEGWDADGCVKHCQIMLHQYDNMNDCMIMYARIYFMCMCALAPNTLQFGVMQWWYSVLQCYAMQYQTMEVNAQKRHPIISQHISCIPMCLFPSRCECFSFASTSTICAFVFLELLFKACRTRVCPVSVKNCSEHSSDLRCLQRKPFHCPLHLQKPFGQRSQQKSINIKNP